VYLLAYNGGKLKKRLLEKKLRLAGWFFKRSGGNHDVWTNGELTEYVPRHNEVSERLAIKIIRKAMSNPKK